MADSKSSSSSRFVLDGPDKLPLLAACTETPGIPHGGDFEFDDIWRFVALVMRYIATRRSARAVSLHEITRALNIVWLYQGYRFPPKTQLYAAMARVDALCGYLAREKFLEYNKGFELPDGLEELTQADCKTKAQKWLQGPVVSGFRPVTVTAPAARLFNALTELAADRADDPEPADSIPLFCQLYAGSFNMSANGAYHPKLVAAYPGSWTQWWCRYTIFGGASEGSEWKGLSTVKDFIDESFWEEMKAIEPTLTKAIRDLLVIQSREAIAPAKCKYTDGSPVFPQLHQAAPAAPVAPVAPAAPVDAKMLDFDAEDAANSAEALRLYDTDTRAYCAFMLQTYHGRNGKRLDDVRVRILGNPEGSICVADMMHPFMLAFAQHPASRGHLEYRVGKTQLTPKDKDPRSRVNAQDKDYLFSVVPVKSGEVPDSGIIVFKAGRQNVAKEALRLYLRGFMLDWARLVALDDKTSDVSKFHATDYFATMDVYVEDDAP